MPIRNNHRIGDYLVMDEESGFVIYRSQARKIWNGTMRHASMFETRQPQEFVRAGRDPKALVDVRSDEIAAKPQNVATTFIGQTTVPLPQGPAHHLYTPGIGEMKVGTTFIVR